MEIDCGTPFGLLCFVTVDRNLKAKIMRICSCMRIGTELQKIVVYAEEENERVSYRLNHPVWWLSVAHS